MSAKVKPGEEVVEMEQCSDGTYDMKAVVPVKKKMPKPQNVAPHIPRPGSMTKLEAFYGFLNGFVVGLDAIQNFVTIVRKRGGPR